MSDQPTMRELRGYIKAAGRRAKAYEYLDSLLGDDLAPSERVLATRKAEIGAAEKSLEILGEKIEAAKAEAVEIITTAKAQADSIVDGARRTSEAAKEEKRAASDQARAVIAKAEREATQIVGDARAEAEQLERAIFTVQRAVAG